MADYPDLPLEAKGAEIEDEILDQWNRGRPKIKDQAILQGTNLRDKLLRAFQQDYTPLKNETSTIHDIVPLQEELSASDIDAIPSPTPVLSSPGLLARNQLIQSWTKRFRNPGQPLSIEGDPVIGLNASQTRAIAMMLGERLSLVQGPPGTVCTLSLSSSLSLMIPRVKHV